MFWANHIVGLKLCMENNSNSRTRPELNDTEYISARRTQYITMHVYRRFVKSITYHDV